MTRLPIWTAPEFPGTTCDDSPIVTRDTWYISAEHQRRAASFLFDSTHGFEGDWTRGGFVDALVAALQSTMLHTEASPIAGEVVKAGLNASRSDASDK